MTVYAALSVSGERHPPRHWLHKPWAAWKDEVLAYLRAAHPTIDALVSRVDVRLLPHAMPRPRPGFLWGESKTAT
jgi:hypothetical protein